MSEIVNKFSIQSYANNNRTKLDESLVSLRFMKEIDRFLDYKKISNKELALKLNYSESYISQLMSGIKKINTSFINKFENAFSTKFDVKIYLKNETEYLHKLDEKNNSI
ncbi:MAG: helix-turn-helix transcriptional regulator [Flavobacterium sp.]|nr:helix-turn-helix transcriptional regulator [Flavobacterium sp.]